MKWTVLAFVLIFAFAFSFVNAAPRTWKEQDGCPHPTMIGAAMTNYKDNNADIVVIYGGTALIENREDKYSQLISDLYEQVSIYNVITNTWSWFNGSNAIDVHEPWHKRANASIEVIREPTTQDLYLYVFGGVCGQSDEFMEPPLSCADDNGNHGFMRIKLDVNDHKFETILQAPQLTFDNYNTPQHAAMHLVYSSEYAEYVLALHGGIFDDGASERIVENMYYFRFANADYTSGGWQRAWKHPTFCASECGTTPDCCSTNFDEDENPRPLFGHCSFVFDGDIYVYGGQSILPDSSFPEQIVNPSANMYKFDVELRTFTGVYSEKAAFNSDPTRELPQARVYPVCGSYGGMIMMYGGFSITKHYKTIMSGSKGEAAVTQQTFAELWYYVLGGSKELGENQYWTKYEPATSVVPGPLDGLTGALVDGGKLLVFGSEQKDPREPKVYVMDAACGPGTQDSLVGGGCARCEPGTASTDYGEGTCGDCEPGHYQPLRGQSACEQCAAGKVQQDGKQTSCDDCGAGYMSPVGAAECSTCFAGEYQPAEGGAICFKCGVGKYTSEPAQPNCIKCAKGTYGTTEGQSECDECGAEMTTAREGATSENECYCNQGFYLNVVGTTRTCVVCPEGGVCEAGSTSPLPDVGYWATNDSRLAIIQCASEAACPGNGYDTCGSGYEPDSFACSDCSKNYYALEDECIECPGNSGVITGLIIGVLGGACIFLYKMAGGKLENITKFKFTTFSVCFNFLQITAVFPSLNLEWPSGIKNLLSQLSLVNVNLEVASPECQVQMSFRTKWTLFIMLPLPVLLLFVLLFILQLLTLRRKAAKAAKDKEDKESGRLVTDDGIERELMTFSSGETLNFPVSMSGLFGAIDQAVQAARQTLQPGDVPPRISVTNPPPAHVDYTWSPPPPQVFGLPDGIIVEVITPMPVLVVPMAYVFPITGVMADIGTEDDKFTQAKRKGKSKESADGKEEEEFTDKPLIASLTRAVNALFMFLGFAYIFLSERALIAFDCQYQEAAGIWTLDSNPGVQCFAKGEWMAVLPLALLSLLLYVVGIPLAFYLTLRLLTKEKRENDHVTLQRFGFLYYRYKPNFYWWEIAVMMRKLGIIAGRLFFTTDAIRQTLVSMATIFLATAAQLAARPYRTTFLNALECILLVCNFLTLLCGVLFFARRSPDSTNEGIVSGFVIMLTSLGFVSMFGLKPFLKAYSKKQMKKKMTEIKTRVNDVQSKEVASSTTQLCRTVFNPHVANLIAPFIAALPNRELKALRSNLLSLFHHKESFKDIEMDRFVDKK